MEAKRKFTADTPTAASAPAATPSGKCMHSNARGSRRWNGHHTVHPLDKMNLHFSSLVAVQLPIFLFRLPVYNFKQTCAVFPHNVPPFDKVFFVVFFWCGFTLPPTCPVVLLHVSPVYRQKYVQKEHSVPSEHSSCIRMRNAAQLRYA